jgi:cbb3-type cytochrome c oxidase subunit III
MLDEKSRDLTQVSEPVRRGLRQMFLVAVLSTLALTVVFQIDDYFTSRRLVAAAPDSIPQSPRLETLGKNRGRNTYLANCAACHGENLRGRPEAGTPAMNDGEWLFGFGRISDIEQTVKFGIRADDPQTRAAGSPGGTCPAWMNKLWPFDIRAVSVYLHSVTREAPGAPPAAATPAP